MNCNARLNKQFNLCLHFLIQSQDEVAYEEAKLISFNQVYFLAHQIQQPILKLEIEVTPTLKLAKVKILQVKKIVQKFVNKIRQTIRQKFHHRYTQAQESTGKTISANDYLLFGKKDEKDEKGLISVLRSFARPASGRQA